MNVKITDAVWDVNQECEESGMTYEQFCKKNKLVNQDGTESDKTLADAADGLVIEIDYELEDEANPTDEEIMEIDYIVGEELARMGRFALVSFNWENE